MISFESDPAWQTFFESIPENTPLDGSPFGEEAPLSREKVKKQIMENIFDFTSKFINHMLQRSRANRKKNMQKF